LSDGTVRGEWERLAAEGLYVFPLPEGGKNPGDLGVKWRSTWVAKRMQPWPRLAFAKGDEAKGLWLATGQISRRVVLDIDSDQAEQRWREVLGDLYDRALKVTTGRGVHLHFRIPDTDEREWPGHSDNDLGYDFRGDGGGVVIPPSVHATGRRYEWAGGDLLDAPECLRHPLRSDKPTEDSNVVELKPSNASRPSSAHKRQNSNVKSLLRNLIESPPSSEGDGRNNWLTQVAGHLAKLFPAPMQDGYTALVRHLGTTLDDPLDEAEALKVADSIWAKQHSGAGLIFEADSGFLAARDGRLYTTVKGEDGLVRVAEWSDFELRARRIVQDDDERTFYVDLVTGHTIYENEPLPADILGNIYRLTVWLTAHHASIAPPANDSCKVSSNTRLLRYLMSQDAPAAEQTPHYGHQADGSFVIPEGILGGGGVEPHGALVPADYLRGHVRYRYGMADRGTAREILREVLTFQDETVASVFGSWWAMALLKGRYPCSMFPFMMLDAGSESGKTTGFFAMMVALAGSMDGAGQHTPASFRDAVAAHRNGIAWLDDMTDVKVSQIADVVRQATSEGSRGKKDADNVGTTNQQLISPIMISGEGSGTMMSEKAMRDRAVRLEFSTPRDRRSLIDPSRLQWDDIVALTAKYGGRVGGLTDLAGSVVSLILDAGTPVLSQMPDLKDTGGRHADKLSILRTGARVLEAVTGDIGHAALVDKWCSERFDEGAANLAVSEILPWVLRAASSGGVPTSAKGWSPVFWDSTRRTLWVSVEQTADLWRERKNLTDREQQLGTADSIRKELKAIGCEGSRMREVGRSLLGKAEGRRYWELPPEWSQRVVSSSGYDL